MAEKMEIKTHPVSRASTPQGSVEGRNAGAYAYPPTSIAAIQASNDLLARSVTLHRAVESFTDSGRHAASDSRDVALIGFDPTFHGHPEDSFRIVANAIYSGLD